MKPPRQTEPQQRIAVVGCGIAGVAAGWELSRLIAAGARAEVTLFEASSRLGGTVETVHEQGFLIEAGPDAWVSEKPWAREAAVELGLAADLLPSNDATRKTHIFLDGCLLPMPDGMRLMVPTDLDQLDSSSLFSAGAKAAYRAEPDRAAELKALAPSHDESIAALVERHFGDEVLRKVAGPLLSGIFGGDVARLSARAIMPGFVALEREYGSLILGLQSTSTSSRSSHREPPAAIFTTLRNGLGTLIDAMVAAIPPASIRLNLAVKSIGRRSGGWLVNHAAGAERFDSVLLAVPAHVARVLLDPLDPRMAELVRMEATSAIVVGLGFSDAGQVPVPAGFGFLVPPGPGCRLLACTFMDQKFPGRAPPGGRLLRAFFGGDAALTLEDRSDAELIALACTELASPLGPGSLPRPTVTTVRRWPRSLPQYAPGHLERMGELAALIPGQPGLWLLGNAYRGVGLPDLIRDGRSAARECLAGGTPHPRT